MVPPPLPAMRPPPLPTRVGAIPDAALGRVSGVQRAAGAAEKTRPSAAPPPLPAPGYSSPAVAPSSLISGTPATVDLPEHAPSRPSKTDGEVTMRSGQAPRWIAGSALLVVLAGFATLIHKGHIAIPLGGTTPRAPELALAAPRDERSAPRERPSGDGAVRATFHHETSAPALPPPIAPAKAPIEALAAAGPAPQAALAMIPRDPIQKLSLRKDEEPEPAAARHAPEAEPAEAPSARTAPAPQTVAAEPGAAPSGDEPASAEAAADAEGTEEAIPPPPPPFNKDAAATALAAAVGRAQSCRKQSDPSGVARVVVTFAISGRVTSATVSGPPYAGTEIGGCIANNFRGAVVPAYSGEPVSVAKTIQIN